MRHMVDNVMDEDEVEEYKEMVMCKGEEGIAVWKEMEEKEFVECIGLY